MITKLQVKHIQSLSDKKCRIDAGVFVVEGEKQVDEVLKSNWAIEAIYALPEWLAAPSNNLRLNTIPCFTISPIEMAKISFHKTPTPVIALLRIPSYNALITPNQAILVDTLQDPGNLGTIIRIADWYGIQRIYLYGACADPWQPKCIQATMGSFLRVELIAFNNINEVASLPYTNRFAAALDGTPPNKAFIHQPGLLMIGNESKGLNPLLQAICTHTLAIPRKGGAESLNAAVATGILCNMWIC
jgi:TrmH family RNA methyltransferase